MSLRRVQVSDFRCLRSVDVEIDPRFTLISGPNASGKTSFLEALYVLGRGRSFRTRRLDHLIATGGSRFVVFGEVELAARRVAMGVEGSGEGLRARIAGQRPGSLAELATILPVQIIDPEVHRLIEEGPSQRRRFLDWGVFHVEPHFVVQWQQYQHALKQRNAALRCRSPLALVQAWNVHLLRFGEAISAARQSYLLRLAPSATTLTRNLLNMELTLGYRPGWSQDKTLEEALLLSVARDRESCATQVGPQRADITIKLDGLPVKDRISRGQQKLLAAAMLMAQLAIFPDDATVRPTLLLDDPAAELDGERLQRLIREVASQAVQLVVTTLSPQLLEFGVPDRHFTVKQGTLVPI